MKIFISNNKLIEKKEEAKEVKLREEEEETFHSSLFHAFLPSIPSSSLCVETLM